MKSVRRTGTQPELAVRAALRALGIRYRADVKTLPGTPDLANKKEAWAIFVHGCFWHGHQGCRLFTQPKSNQQFWSDKVRSNRTRDLRKRRALQQSGYQVLTIWQCEVERPTVLSRRLQRFFGLGET